MDKKLLIISNEAFSSAGSNSRTIKNLLLSIAKKNIAQVYIHGVPDTDFCSHYYHVSDHYALRTFLSMTMPSKEKQKQKVSAKEPKTNPQKSYRNLVLRNLVWMSMRWWTKEFDEFLDAFHPEVVLLQAGDAPFMYAIAMKIAKKYDAKLMMFNTENYVLKKRMYASQKFNPFWHYLLMSSLRSQYQKFMGQADYCIYGTEYLEQCYQEKYPHPGKSACFYTGTEMQDCSLLPCKKEGFSLVYCGNLGVGRVPVLCTIAQVLKSVDIEAKLVIYGKFVSEEDRVQLCAYDNVEFCGFIPYEEIPVVLARASMVIHCENTDRLENLKTAFSTKIADSLACGKPFLVFASKEYPFVMYLDKNHAAHIAETPEELSKVLNQCITDAEYKEQYLSNARKLARENHNALRNSQAFVEILNQ